MIDGRPPVQLVALVGRRKSPAPVSLLRLAGNGERAPGGQQAEWGEQVAGGRKKWKKWKKWKK